LFSCEVAAKQPVHIFERNTPIKNARKQTASILQNNALIECFTNTYVRKEGYAGTKKT